MRRFRSMVMGGFHIGSLYIFSSLQGLGHTRNQIFIAYIR